MKFRIRPVKYKGVLLFACEYSYYGLKWSPVETDIAGLEEYPVYYTTRQACIRARYRFLDKIDKETKHLNIPIEMI